MCGIFAILNDEDVIIKNSSTEFIKEQFIKGARRGPEYSILRYVDYKVMFGFHRLAINGLNSESNQPIIINNISLICNGEIYNYKELYSIMGLEPTTDSDCEVIIHLYRKYGMEQTLQMLDGVFAFILCDSQMANESKLYVARDPYGVRPLYVLKSNLSISFKAFASELKSLCEFTNEENVIEHFKPGTYSEYYLPYRACSEWCLKSDYVVYHTFGFNSLSEDKNLYENIQLYLGKAVEKRVLVTERPVACLLSGGLDSSLITALVNEYNKKITDKPLETYSIGLSGSEDLRCARIVAEYLGTNHHEIVLTEEEFCSEIPEVIEAIESYDTTTVRASIGNYLLGKYISETSDAKVIFNGDGSDELCGGYLYMYKAPDAVEFDKECRRLLKDIHLFDVLRSDKCISSHGLEPRTPFLDRAWVQFYLGIPIKLRFHPGNEGQCEKYLLRTAFSKDHYLNAEGKPLLPDCILWRTKEAFSDGVSKNTRSLFTIIQEYIETVDADKMEEKWNKGSCPANTKEKQYYRKIFEEKYPRNSTVIPYFWMPHYTDAIDASARTLEFYKEFHTNG